MAGPYTAFTYGDPTVSPAVFTVAVSLVGFSTYGSATPVPFCSSLLGGVVGTAYSVTVQATGGAGSYTFTVLTGSLPSGLSMSSGGVISGTPTAVGSSTFTVKATDLYGTIGTQSFTIPIRAATTSGASNYGYAA